MSFGGIDAAAQWRKNEKQAGVARVPFLDVGRDFQRDA